MTKFAEYNLEFSLELDAINSLINSGRISHDRYTELVVRAIESFTDALATL